MKDIKVLGIDLAKDNFQIHGTDLHGKKIISKKMNRKKLIEFIANLSPCLIGIEACGGSHYFARTFKNYGHEVKIMAPQYVKPYVMSNKNDMNDAKGIAEAVTRPAMKFVASKTIEQQDILLIHRARELIVKQRTALSNQIRGLLQEYGVVIAKGLTKINRLPEILEENSDQLTSRSTGIFLRLYEQFKILSAQVETYNLEIEKVVQTNEACQRILKIKGVGVIGASAIIATIGDAKVFKNGREVSAWLGLTPRQYSSGNKIKLGGISKRGDKYVRTLLIHGARSVVNVCDRKTDVMSQWVLDKKNRCGKNKAAVALANKNARIIWSMLVKGEKYHEPRLAH